MTNNNQTEILANLLGKRSIFCSTSINSICAFQDYSIFMGVPAHCLEENNSNVDIEQVFPHHVIDLLICRGKEAIQAIVFDAEHRDMEKLFSSCLHTLPHQFLKSDELTNEYAENLCGEIEFQLRCDRSAPLHTGIMLYSLHIQYTIFQMHEASVTKKA